MVIDFSLTRQVDLIDVVGAEANDNRLRIVYCPVASSKAGKVVRCGD